jgi:hypothetical protein
VDTYTADVERAAADVGPRSLRVASQYPTGQQCFAAALVADGDTATALHEVVNLRPAAVGSWLAPLAYTGSYC